MKIAIEYSYTGIMNLENLARYAISVARFVFSTTNYHRNG